jgi:hypothetical protein
MKNNKYTTGTNQILYNVHAPTANCYNFGCVIHNPSDHPLRNAPTHYRFDTKIMERLCEHGVGHPDPDDPNYNTKIFRQARTVAATHGCDGCCTKGNE